MSLRSRARRLQRATGLTYQQAVAKLRELGSAPAELSRKFGWPLPECDLYLVHRASLTPRAAIEVLSLEDGADPIACICSQLLTTTNARSVSVLGPRAEPIAQVGEVRPNRFWLAQLAIVHCSARNERAHFPREPLVIQGESGDVIFSMVLREKSILAVRFTTNETSLGLVRLRAAHVIDDLERALAARRRSRSAGPAPTGTPPRGMGGSGAPFWAWNRGLGRGAA
jgi:hypothetical protein